MLNEADGARSVSLKLPRRGEPVLMRNSGYLIPVIGLDVIGNPVGSEAVFRWTPEEARLPVTAGEPITPLVAAHVLMHPDGVCRGWSPGVQVIPFINKVDAETDDATARELAVAILGSSAFPVSRVLWGSVARGRVAALRRDEL